MIKSAQNKPVAELLSVDSNWRFKVPRYQREYVWRRDDWANLFDDLYENPPGYFLGSMICINRSEDAMQVQDLEVVDGQQRLTTISLLYAAIYACLAGVRGRSEDTKHELFNRSPPPFSKDRRKCFAWNHLPGTQLSGLRCHPTGGGHSCRCGDIAQCRQPPTLQGDSGISLTALMSWTTGHRVFDPDCIQEFLDRSITASLVKIEVGSHADAFTLFESLNNRGVPLSAFDLMKE